MLRFCEQIGIFRTIFLVLLGCLLTAILYKKVDNLYLPILFFSLIYSYQSYRKDQNFLKNQISNTYKVFWIDYSLLSLYFVAISATKGFYTDLLLYPVIVLIVPFIFKVRFQKISFAIPFFRTGSYEYQSMFRKNYIFLFILYLVSFIGLYNNNDRILYFCYCLSGLLWLLPLLKPEPTMYTLNYRRSAYLIQEKCINIVFNTVVLSLPFFIIGLFEASITIYPLSLLFINLIVISINSNFLKYSLYNNTFICSIITFFVIVPIAIMTAIHPLFVCVNIILGLFIILRASDKLDLLFNYDNNREPK